ncbi:hypothetical protein K435DRAFT_717815 [Dendrothele bispora CBS 962.96]|uniref:Uncharacterized protein n=1 Tax=Dendrothele bispora (strain CBS 962.96) TaxID=1314807 RepID=A0A4S8MH60_DENBC|nr:hypothetical protein K435DRAFT_717815 [Dendrothele bispora CBS 962.96]
MDHNPYSQSHSEIKPDGKKSHTKHQDVRQRKARNAYERALLKLPPGITVPESWFPTDEEMNESFLAQGYSKEELPRIRKLYHERINKRFKDAKRDTVNVIGLKPSKGDQIYAVEIPGSPLSIRLWNGGLLGQGIYSLDFINTETREPVNPPRDYELYPCARVGEPPYMPLISWERAMKIPDEKIEPGAERFSIPHGVNCCLKRHGMDDFWFEVPRSTIGVQMTATTA